MVPINMLQEGSAVFHIEKSCLGSLSTKSTVLFLEVKGNSGLIMPSPASAIFGQKDPMALISQSKVIIC